MRNNIHVVSFMIWLVIAFGFAVVPARAQSPSELFERGVYNEETVGDLERAIEIYEKIVDDATAHRPYVAEALFRIGMCQLKSDDTAAATEAFERILAEYPEQETFVALARENMPDGPENIEFQPAPWRDGEVERLSLKLASGTEIGTLILTVDPADVDGVEAWRMRTRRRIYSDADNQAVSEVLARRDDLTPVRSTFKHVLLGHFEATYGADEVRITTVGPDTTREEKLAGRFFDNEQGFHVFRLLPLEDGYRATLNFITTVAGAAEPVDIEIAGVETVSVPAGEFESYRMTFGELPQTFWYSTDANHYLVKLEASGIVGELEEVYVRDPGKSTVHVDDAAGFSVTAPPGWLYAPFDDHGIPKVVLLDPKADARAVVRLHPANGVCSFQAAAFRKRREYEQIYKDFTLRPGSWHEREIDGRPAVSFIGDLHEGERAIAQYWTYVESGKYCVEFDFKVATERLADLREDFDAIVAGYDGPREPAPQKPAAAAPATERVKAVLTGFHRAAAEADLDTYVGYLSPDLTFLGTDRTERLDREGLVALAQRSFSQGIGWIAEPVEQNVFVSGDGATAWFDEKLESQNFGELRASGVLRLEDRGWRIVQYNVVFPIPNDLAFDLVAQIAEVDPEVMDRPMKFSDAPPLDDADPAHDVKATLRDFHLAASEASAARYFKHFAPDVVSFGTDRSERYTLEKIRAFAGPYLAAGTGWTSVPFEQHVSFSPDRQIAWFEQHLGREGIGELRSTGVMRKDDGKWRIVHYNLALPVPNELAEGLVAKIRGFYGPG